MELERRIGTVLRDQWTLERLLGSGSATAVYVGLHKTGRRDAIKILHPHIVRQPEIRARFDQEARAAKRFVNSGAVEIRDIDVTEDGCPFLAMELLEGESLRARCDRLGPPEMAEILRIADDVLDVLAAAHAQGIIHRDIRPDNLFCLPDGRIKVLDFGLAHVHQACAAPEHAKGLEVDGRGDLFALAALMFRLIANRSVHQASAGAELALEMATHQAPPLASVAPGVPAEVCSIVDRALAFDREGRYPNAIAMRRAIRAARKQVPGAAQPDHVDQDAPTRVLNAAAPAVRPALGPPGHGVAAVTPRRTRLTALTQWTVTTMQERRLRWAALVFPLIAAGVLALVFYGVTRVDRQEADPEPASQETARLPVVPAAAEAPIAAAAPEPAVKQPDPAEPQAPALTPPVNCFLTNDCDHLCEDECKVECTTRSGCTIGVVHDAMLRCRGPAPCVASCAGKCTINTGPGVPVVVQCTLGFECEIEGCPAQVERCSPLLLACGTPCPR